MGLLRAGRLILSPVRNVTSNDSTYPTGNSPTGVVEVPQTARGAITHVWININGSAASPSAIVDILGLPFNSSEKPEFPSTFQGLWIPCVQLNSGGAINQTSISRTAPASNLAHYSEAFSHLSAYKKLFALVTSITNASSVDVQFAFETL